MNLSAGENIVSLQDHYERAISQTNTQPKAEYELVFYKDDLGNQKQLALYPTQSSYALEAELDLLSNRALEPNIFFSGSFLAPAMPRLDDRAIKLLTVRDVNEERTRLRFAMPLTIEKPSLGFGPTILRAWSTYDSPLGTPLIDRENPEQTIDDLLTAIIPGNPHLPQILVFPNLRLDGAFTQKLRGVSLIRNLPIQEVDISHRPILENETDADDYLIQSISKHHFRELSRQARRLSEQGDLNYVVSRHSDDVRFALEDFLHLENQGWKGEKRTSLVAERRRAAFARESINGLAELDRVRIHALKLDDQTIASLITFVMGGEAFTWKTTFDENYAAFSPGKLLMKHVTQWHLDDFNIVMSDSCAAHDHPIMSRFWKERCRVGTLILATQNNMDREVRQVAAQLELYSNSRSIAKKLRDKVLNMARMKKA